MFFKKIKCELGDNALFILWGMDSVNSHLCQDLAQIISLSKKKTKIIIVDTEKVKTDDTIEGKFLAGDIGKYKSIVSQKRCSSSFRDLDVVARLDSINSKEELMEILTAHVGYTPVIISKDVHERNMIINEVMSEVYNMVSFRHYYDSEKGYCYFVYKKDGEMLSKEISNEDKKLVQYFGFTDKLISLELAKTIFLYIDDFICSRETSVNGTFVDTEKMASISKLIDKSFISYSIEDNDLENIVVNVGDKILVILIGVGGTGASLAYEISHFVKNYPNKEFKILFIDGDRVEEKNLNRQRFVMQDVGGFKSSVTSNRCMNAYDIDILTSTEYIDKDLDLYEIMDDFSDYYPIILGCSDSLKLRYLISNAITSKENNRNLVYIDGGNDEDRGQVVCTIIKDGKEVTPSFFNLFPEALEDVHKAKLVTELSCDELMVSAPQTKGANMASAAGIYMFFDSVVNGKPIDCIGLTFNNVMKIIEKIKKDS